MTTWESTRRVHGAWLLAVLGVVLTTTSLMVQPHVGSGTLLALDAVVLCLAALVLLARSRPPAPAQVAVLVRTAVRADTPRLRESAPGVPGHAWPRAPGRLPR